MKFELPTKKVKATRINPKKLIIFGKPKSGKTTCLSQLEDCLILDLENGLNISDFRDNIHLNSKGQVKIASSIVKYMKSIKPN